MSTLVPEPPPPQGETTTRELARNLRLLIGIAPAPIWPILGLAVALSGCESALMAVMLPILKLLEGASNASSPGLGESGWLDAWTTGFEPATRLRCWAVLFGVLSMLAAAVRYFNNVAQARYAARTGEAIRQRVFASYVARDYPFFMAHRQGRLLEDIAKQPNLALRALMATLRLFGDIATATLLLCLLFALSWKATIGALVVSLLLARGFGMLRRRIADIGRREVDNQRALVALVTEVVGGIRQIKLLAMEHRLQGDHDELSKARVDLVTRRSRIGELPSFATQCFIGLLVGGGLAAFSLLAYDEQRRLLPVIGVFGVVSLRLLPLLTGISSAYIQIFQHSHTLAFLADAIRNPPARSGGTLVPPRILAQGIRFEGVRFQYPATRVDDVAEGDPRPTVLTDIDLEIPAGRRVALVGPSGAGKSTLLDLLARLFEPNAGSITLDGTPLGEFELGALRRAIGYVSQETFLFHGTIRENICYAGSVDPVRLRRAIELSHAHEFIDALPDGDLTMIGDRGVRLSGGQRQRIAIARAVLDDPPILIFDEATSALDQHSEAMVRAGIAAASEGRTVIIVAHRPSTLALCDLAYTLRDGRVVERGPPATLLRQGGYYASVHG